MSQDFSKLSIRAATWLGSQCLNQYCLENNIVDDRINHLCKYLAVLATETDVPAWDELGNTLEITGLGDPMPMEYTSNKELEEIISCVREISACQIYGAWKPEYTANFLGRAMCLAGLKLTNQTFELLISHKPLEHGWGDPVSEVTLGLWQAKVSSRGQRP